MCPREYWFKRILESIEGIGTGNTGVISDFMRKVVVWGITLTYFSENEKRKNGEKMEKKMESKIEHKIEKKKKKTPEWIN